MNAVQARTSRIVLGIEYDGRTYSGWQAQKNPKVDTVQEELEVALSKVANHPVKLTCAGRTDSGVHASAQIVHFDTSSERELSAWVKGGNSFLLDRKISVLWAQHVDDDFHARFSAESRRYSYIIYNNPVRPALMSGLVTPFFYPLNEKDMHTAGQHLLGEQDFTSYRGVACQSNTPMRNIMSLQVRRYGEYVIMDIEANAFLLHMVRNIIGVLLEIGEGKRDVHWTKEVLAMKDRSCAGVTARPDGLYLVKVRYPEKFALPDLKAGPAWLQGLRLI